MPRGIGAAIFVISLIMSMSILAGLGYYGSIGRGQIDASSHNDDVKDAAKVLNSSAEDGGIGFAEGRSSSILQGPLAAVTPVISIAMTIVTVIGNTSGVIQLLFGIPAPIADIIEMFFRISMLVTILYMIRSGSPV